MHLQLQKLAGAVQREVARIDLCNRPNLRRGDCAVNRCHASPGEYFHAMVPAGTRFSKADPLRCTAWCGEQLWTHAVSDLFTCRINHPAYPARRVTSFLRWSDRIDVWPGLERKRPLGMRMRVWITGTSSTQRSYLVGSEGPRTPGPKAGEQR